MIEIIKVEDDEPPERNKGTRDEPGDTDRDSLLLWGLSYGRRQMGRRNICNAWLYLNKQRNQPGLAVVNH